MTLVSFLKKNSNLLLILALVFVSAIIVNPLGNFTINDDWFYYRAALDFNFKDFSLDSLIAPSLVGQLFLVWPIIHFLGFSFTGLRFFTLFLATLGTLVFYGLILKINSDKKKALFLSLLLFFNPVFFSSSFTFMTDIPALFFVILALFFSYSFFCQPKIKKSLSIYALAIYAIFIRQIQATVFFFQFLLLPRKAIKKYLAVYLLLAVVAILAFWQAKKIGWWPIQALEMHSFGRQNWQNVFGSFFSMWQYLAIFLLPIIISWFLKVEKRIKIIALISGLIFVIGHLGVKSYWLYFKNLINVWGIGAIGPEVTLSGFPRALISDKIVFYTSLLAAFCIGVLLVFLIYSFIKNRQILKNRFVYFLLANFLAQGLAIAVLSSFDRYYLGPLVFVLVLIAFFVDWQPKVLGWLILFLLTVFSIFGTADYLNEKRSVWLIADNLTQNGIAVSKIDAGYEWLGWNFYQKNQKLMPDIDNSKPWYINSIFPSQEREYVVSYSQEDKNYGVIGEYLIGGFLNPSKKLYLLQKK